MVFLEKETGEMDWGVGGKGYYFLSSSQIGPLRVPDICGDIFLSAAAACGSYY